jgi:hypothetical protein
MGVRGVRLGEGAEIIAGLRGTDPISPYRHGSIGLSRYYLDPLVFPLDVFFDAPAGKRTFEGLLYGAAGVAELRRTTELGEALVSVRQIGSSVMGQDVLSYQYALVAAEGSWRLASQTTDSTTPIANVGNAPVGDAVIDIDTSASGTDVVVTMTGDGATITIEGATPTGGVRVDLGTGLITELGGSTDYGEFVSFNKPYGVILEPGSNAFTTSGGPSEVTFKFFPRLR